MRRLPTITAVLVTAMVTAAVTVGFASGTGTPLSPARATAPSPWMAAGQWSSPDLTFADCQQESGPALRAEGMPIVTKGPSRSWYGRDSNGPVSAVIICYEGPNGDVWATIAAAHESSFAAARTVALALQKRLFGASGLTWTGTWSTNYGDVMLKQTGNSVRGTYYGGDGKIAGTVSGRTLGGTWTEQGGSRTGRLEFVMSANGKFFTGKWGYNDEPLTRGWSGTRK